MSEYEILDLVASNGESLSSSFSVYLSLMSAYLAVGYLVGAKLSKAQFICLSLLFFYGAGGQALGQFNINTQNAELFARLAEIRALNAFESQYVANGMTWSAVMALGVFAALIYMWSVRRPKSG